MEIRKATSIPSIVLLPVLILFVALFVFFLYTFLHEAGHALVGLIFGQTLTEFDVSFWDLSARAGLTGGALTQTQLAVRTVAGVCLPLLTWLVFILLVPRKGNAALEILKLISSMAVISTLLVWIILPVLFLFGKAPSDDVFYFLKYGHIQPLLLTIVALILYVGGWMVFLARIDGLRNEFLLFRATKYEVLFAGTRNTILMMAAVVMLGIAVVFTLNTAAAKNQVDRLSPPQDFESLGTFDLSKQAYSSETLKQFVLEKPSFVAVFIKIQNINTTYFDVSVNGPNGFHSTILHGEGYNAAQDGGLWEKNLPAGTYQITLTSHQSPGTTSIYFKIH